MNCTAIVTAGGLGKRFGGDKPKQFYELNGIPMLVHTLRIFENAPEINSIVIPVHSEWYKTTEDLVSKYELKKVREITIGGKIRQESVSNALHTTAVEEADIILVHDAVRPLTTHDLIKNIIEQAEEFGAAIPGVLPIETIKERSGNGTVMKTLDRRRLCRVQTPQGFWQELIVNAYKSATEAGYIGTDSSSLVEFIGYKVQVIDGEESNLKITTPLDRKVAEMILNER